MREVEAIAGRAYRTATAPDPPLGPARVHPPGRAGRRRMRPTQLPPSESFLASTALRTRHRPDRAPRFGETEPHGAWGRIPACTPLARSCQPLGGGRRAGASTGLPAWPRRSASVCVGAVLAAASKRYQRVRESSTGRAPLGRLLGTLVVPEPTPATSSGCATSSGRASFAASSFTPDRVPSSSATTFSPHPSRRSGREPPIGIRSLIGIRSPAPDALRPRLYESRRTLAA